MAQNTVAINNSANVMAVQKCPTAVQTATVVHTNGHNVVVAILSETAANPVHISYLLWTWTENFKLSSEKLHITRKQSICFTWN